MTVFGDLIEVMILVHVTASYFALYCRWYSMAQLYPTPLSATPQLPPQISRPQQRPARHLFPASISKMQAAAGAFLLMQFAGRCT